MKFLDYEFASLHEGQGFNGEGDRRAKANSFEPMALLMVDLLCGSFRTFQRVCVLFMIHQNGTEMHVN